MKRLMIAALYAILGLAIGAGAVYIYYMQSRPDPQVWHLAALEGEFRADQAAEVADLEGYRRLEDALFEELERKVYAAAPADTPGQLFNRYSHGSWSDPERFDVNWNRTFELGPVPPGGHPRMGVLLLHGMSDSPYSLRGPAQALAERGAWVVGLRIPGHGTAPSGLLDAHRRDFQAAVRMAARDVAGRLGADTPFYIIGYSNGAALAVDYALEALETRDYRLPEGLVLISPAIGVSPGAKYAKWVLALARIPGLEKIAWLSIQPEFDPFKYNSFPVNAGKQVYGMTQDIAARIDRLDRGHGVEGFPPTLAFQSLVDATVSTRALVDGFFERLAPNGHHLVVFDINRESDTAAMLGTDPLPDVDALFREDLPFHLTLITNRNPDTHRMEARDKPAAGQALPPRPLDLHWPNGVYSLSHVALPFATDDPVYGRSPTGDPSVTLGSVEPRGEIGLLLVPMNQLMRLRYNPFYDYFQDRSLAHFGLEAPAAGPMGSANHE